MKLSVYLLYWCNSTNTDTVLDGFLTGVKGIEWKRPNEWGDPAAKIVIWSGGIDPDDVAQVYVKISAKYICAGILVE